MENRKDRAPNNLDDMTKISGNNVASAVWLLLDACDKIQEERDGLKERTFHFS